MAQSTRNANGSQVVVGIDVGDKRCTFCQLDCEGQIQRQGSCATTQRGLQRIFAARERCLIVLEAGAHSRWMSNFLKKLGHELVVANPRRLALIYGDLKKNDDVDAEKLARLGRVDIQLLSPVQHRSDKAQAHLTIIKARGTLVASRTKIINHIRQTVKGFGIRLPSCSSEGFAKKIASLIPDQLAPALMPLVSLLDGLTQEIRDYDRKIDLLSEKFYPETTVLRQVTGVGPLTSLAYLLTLEDPGRFPTSRTVGAFLGLVPRQDRSGETDRQLRITKAGNKDLRVLLISCAHHILGWRGPDCELRRYGERIAARGGKSTKKKAVVAVARKLAVLLHHLWKTGEVYDPEHKTTKRSRRRKAS